MNEERECPKCGGPMWDNRAKKTNPKAPDFKCKDKENCDGVIWPPRDNTPRQVADYEAPKRTAWSHQAKQPDPEARGKTRCKVFCAVVAKEGLDAALSMQSKIELGVSFIMTGPAAPTEPETPKKISEEVNGADLDDIGF